MFRNLSSPFSRLRRHRGLWVLALCVMVIKLVSGSVCLADSPSTSLQAHAYEIASVVPDSAPADPGCILGEAADCHCACAHTAPVPPAASTALTLAPSGFVPAVISPGLRPVPARSPLRPPIA
jgi:hypothetical protein